MISLPIYISKVSLSCFPPSEDMVIRFLSAKISDLSDLRLKYLLLVDELICHFILEKIFLTLFGPGIVLFYSLFKMGFSLSLNIKGLEGLEAVYAVLFHKKKSLYGFTLGSLWCMKC